MQRKGGVRAMDEEGACNPMIAMDDEGAWGATIALG
jgi:hypothetical protein